MTSLVRIGSGDLNFAGLLQSTVKPQIRNAALDDVSLQCKMADFLLMKGT